VGRGGFAFFRNRAVLSLFFILSPVCGQAEDEDLDSRLQKIEERLAQIQKSQNELLELADFRAGKEKVKIGEMAPLFKTETLEGKNLRLEDFRGKYVLLDFWSTWCQPSKEETLLLKSVQQKFSTATNLVFVGLSLDDQPEKSLQFLRSNGIERQEGFLGNWNRDIFRNGPSRMYGVNAIPSLWLIGPDGKVLAKDLRGMAVEKALEEALRPSHPPTSP